MRKAGKQEAGGLEFSCFPTFLILLLISRFCAKPRTANKDQARQGLKCAPNLAPFGAAAQPIAAGEGRWDHGRKLTRPCLSPAPPLSSRPLGDGRRAAAVRRCSERRRRADMSSNRNRSSMDDSMPSRPGLSTAMAAETMRNAGLSY